MRSDVLFALAEGRAESIRRGNEPPFVACLLPKRADRLRGEMRRLGTVFGIPFAAVPEPREDDEKWTYLGIVLSDVHVYARGS